MRRWQPRGERLGVGAEAGIEIARHLAGIAERGADIVIASHQEIMALDNARALRGGIAGRVLGQLL